MQTQLCKKSHAGWRIIFFVFELCLLYFSHTFSTYYISFCSNLLVFQFIVKSLFFELKYLINCSKILPAYLIKSPALFYGYYPSASLTFSSISGGLNWPEEALTITDLQAMTMLKK